MAVNLVFADSFTDGRSERTVDFECVMSDEASVDRGLIVLTLKGKVRHPAEKAAIESFDCVVRAEFENPIGFTVATGLLFPYGACVVLNASAALMEAANDAYEATKLKGEHGWRSCAETVAIVSNEILKQGPKLRGKVLAGLVVCIPALASLGT